MSDVSFNIAEVKDPKWTGKSGERVIVVGRGEPRRTNAQMQQAVYGQIQRYMAAHGTHPLSDFEISMTSQLIAKDHIDPEGKQLVLIFREQLLAYIDLAIEKLKDRATVEPDPKSGW